MAIDAMSDGILQRGERGADVKGLQVDLAALGLYDGVQDGVFGFGTEAAVMAFQRGAHLGDDGYAGPKTLAAIRQAREPQPVAIVVPAGIGHNGGPAMEPAVVVPSTPAPTGVPALVGSVSKALGAARGAAQGAAITPAITLIGSKLGIFPAWIFEPEAIAAITLVGGVVIAGIWAFVSTYKAKPNTVSQV